MNKKRIDEIAKELTKDMDSRVWVFNASGVAPSFYYEPQHVFALQVTEDIDYELIEPSQIPPSNTNDE
jgi:hypothetical protein